MNASGPDCETHREDNYLWSHLVSVSLNKVFTFSMFHSSALCGWLWLRDLLSKFKENNIPQISTRRNWLKKAKSQRGLLWAYLKVCAYVCVCVWVSEWRECKRWKNSATHALPGQKWDGWQVQHLRVAFRTHCHLQSSQPSIFPALVPLPARCLLRAC